MPITNWTEFFKEERDVFVQNVANAQVSIEFETAPGHAEGFLFKQTRDPVNLTQHIPFAAIKGSIQFRKMINRNPPVLTLLTEAEYNTWYERKAARSGSTPEEVIAKAAEERKALAEKPKLTPTSLPDSDDQGSAAPPEPVSEEEVINPRVLHLMTQVSMELQPAERMPAKELLQQLQDMEDALTIDDLEYVRSRGTYQIVKKWAATLASTKVAQAQGEGLTEEDVK
jgi:hypothetical protein